MNTTTLQERLAALDPQKRELLLRQMAQAKANHSAPKMSLIENIQSLPAIEEGQTFPQSLEQQRIWFAERMQADQGIYNMVSQFHLNGALDLIALQQSVDNLIARHDALRLSFSEVAGRPVQTLRKHVSLNLEVIDVRSLDKNQRDARLQQLLQKDGERPFNLAHAPLLRVTLLRLADEEQVLQIVLHHIICDGWAVAIFHRELAQLYQEFKMQQATQLTALEIDFANVVRWQALPEQQQQLTKQIAFWQNNLQGHSAYLDFPKDHTQQTINATQGARHGFSLSPTLHDAILEIAQQQACTPFLILLSTFQALLSRYCGQDDIIVGTPIANRQHAEFEALLGMFTNTLALRADLSGDTSFQELLQRNKSHFLDALTHSSAPLEKIIDGLALERVPGRAPLVQAMFVFDVSNEHPFSLHATQTQTLQHHISNTRFELTLSIEQTAHGFEGVFDYDASIFDEDSIARFSEQYAALLHAVKAQIKLPIARLNLLTEAAKNQLLALGNGGPRLAALTDIQFDSLHELLPIAAQRCPDALAIIDGDVQLSYQDLAQRVAHLARQLQTHHIGLESRVALLADRSAESIIAILAILAVGAAYIPLDPSYPDERAAFVLNDAQVTALVSPPALLIRAHQLAALRSGLSEALFQVHAARQSLPPLERLPLMPAPAGANNTAYIIYTSGSTGNPKGVVIEHRHAMNLVQGFVAQHRFTGQRLLMIPPLVFDASVGDVFPVLATGACLVLHRAPNELGALELREFCQRHQVTAIDAPAALWRRWTEGLLALNTEEEILPSLQLMMFGGEAVTMEQVQRFASLTKQRVTLSNHYGPTEAAVCATMLTTINASELSGAELSIGKPLPGVSIYLLDQHLQLAPQGVVAELCIGGAGVARGYLNAPELTEKQFVHDPFRSEPNAKMYRTGDLARWGSDGNLQFIGRRDHQIKLRGFRIELGEIETALMQCSGVQAAVAAVCEIRPGDKRIVAYFVADDAVTHSQLRSQLAQRLPEAMQPSIYQRLASLALTVNGKVDRRKLPAPNLDDVAARSLRLPASEIETKLLAIWQTLLAHNDLSTDDNFFQVGGDSLMTLSLVHHIKQVFAIDVPLANVFSAPTLIELAQVIDNLKQGIQLPSFDLNSKVQLAPEIDPRFAKPVHHPRHAPQVVFITGATGFLGAYLLRELLDCTTAHILCLVRAENAAEGVQRIIGNLKNYALWPDDKAICEHFTQRIQALLGDLGQTQFGLNSIDFQELIERTDVIFHNGGQVNFIAPYDSMEAANVAGTREVLRVACSGHIKPVHFVSTLGVYFNEDYLTDTITESSAPPTGSSQQGGYNQSKWVAEQLCLLAKERGLPVAIYRPARITGDSRTGSGNLSDYFNSWFKGCVQLGMLPYLPEDSFDMAPVDYVARAIVRFALGGADQNGIFHFLNAHRLPLLSAAKTLEERGFELNFVPYSTWREALRNAATHSRNNALSSFASLYPEQADAREPNFVCQATESIAASLGLHCPEGNQELFGRYLDFMIERDFLPQTQQQELV